MGKLRLLWQHVTPKMNHPKKRPGAFGLVELYMAFTDV